MRPLIVVAVFAVLLAFYTGRHLTVEDHVVYDRIAPGVQHFVNSKGMAVHWRRLGNHVANATAVIIAVHGFREHLGYYEDISAEVYNPEVWPDVVAVSVPFFCHESRHLRSLSVAQGWVVYGVDHIGHGLSEGERGYVSNVFQVRDDLMQFVKTIVKPKHPSLPLFVHGHSLG